MNLPTFFSLIVLTVTSAIAFLTSCSNDSEKKDGEEGVVGERKTSQKCPSGFSGRSLRGNHEAYPMEAPEMFRGYVMDYFAAEPREYTLQELDGLAVIDGDIVLGPVADFQSFADSKASASRLAARWRYAQIPYVLPQDFPERKIVEAAINHINRDTVIEMYPRTNEANYLAFVLTSNPYIGGKSFLGMQEGEQKLWLNADTSRWSQGTVVHELGHALGLTHEQNRLDRDDYVEIIWENINPGYRSQFEQAFSTGIDIGEFDFQSALIYPKNAFSCNGRDTIKPKNGRIMTRSSNSQFSSGDISGLAIFYQKEVVRREAKRSAEREG